MVNNQLIFISSGGRSGTENTLSAFTNQFSCTIPNLQNFCGAIEEVGISNHFAPVNHRTDIPSIIWKGNHTISHSFSKLITSRQELLSEFVNLNETLEDKLYLTLLHTSIAPNYQKVVIDEFGKNYFTPSADTLRLTISSRDGDGHIFIEERFFQSFHFRAEDIVQCTEVTINDNIYFRLRIVEGEEVSLHSLFDVSETNLPPFIHITSPDFDSWLNTGSKEIATFSPKISHPYTIRKFKNPTYLPLQCTNLNSLSFKFVDPWGKQLSLRSGYSTYILLRLKEMEIGDQFTVQVSSKKSDLRPRNTIHDFVHDLPSDILFRSEEKWEVSLLDCHFPATFSSFQNPVFCVEWSAKHWKEMRFNIKPDRFTPETLTNTLNLKTVYTDFMFNPKTARFTIVARRHDLGPITVVLAHELAAFLGFSEPSARVGHKIVLNEKNGFRRSAQNIVAETVNQPPFGLLFCNFIRPIISSDGNVKLLKVLPIYTSEQGMNDHEFINEDARELCVSRLSSLVFSFKTHSGENIPFLDNNALLTFRLSFRKVKSV